MAPHKKSERKSPSQGVVPKCDLQERNLWAPKMDERTQDETLKQERCQTLREFEVHSGASMHMPSKKDISSGEMETLRKSRNSTTVVTANGEVQTNNRAHWRSSGSA